MEKLVINYKKNHRIKYPVGIKISDNIATIKEAIREFLKSEKRNLIGFDIVFVCTGSSGAIISTIAYEIFSKHKGFGKLRINYIPKIGEISHSGGYCAVYEKQKIIFLDDFAETGETIRGVYKRLKYNESFKGFDYMVFIGSITGLYENLIDDVELNWGKLYCSD